MGPLKQLLKKGFYDLGQKGHFGGAEYKPNLKGGFAKHIIGGEGLH